MKTVKTTTDNNSSNNKQDTVLINAIKLGDTSAFKTLVEKYKDVSFSLVCSVVKNEQDAEDVLQDAFIKVYKGIKKFKHKSAFSTWLYRVVLNTSLNAVTKQEKNFFNKDYNNKFFEDESSYLQEISDDETLNGYHNLLQKDRKNLIQQALKTMKPDESLLLRLYYLAEKDVKEICEITGYKESKIKVTLYRGRKNLYVLLKKIFGKEFKTAL